MWESFFAKVLHSFTHTYLPRYRCKIETHHTHHQRLTTFDANIYCWKNTFSKIFISNLFKLLLSSSSSSSFVVVDFVVFVSFDAVADFFFFRIQVFTTFWRLVNCQCFYICQIIGLLRSWKPSSHCCLYRQIAAIVFLRKLLYPQNKLWIWNQNRTCDQCEQMVRSFFNI